MPSNPVIQTIGFLGSGRMATALAQGMIQAKFSAASSMLGADVSRSARDSFQQETGVEAVVSNLEVAKRCDVLFLAVKPQYAEPVLREIASELTAEHLVISIAAGVSLSRMRTCVGEKCGLVRVMPNTPALVGAGASAFALDRATPVTVGGRVQAMLSTVGIAMEVPESMLDGVTGLSGSGPAYAFQIIEALSDGGVRVGLSRDVATRLAAQTLLGAARMVLETGEHPGSLKDAVTSPGGTTIAGLHAMEQAGVRGALIDAVVAATERSRELGRS